MSHIRTFWSDQSGAITVDWMVLTAAVVSMAISAYLVVFDAGDELFTEIDAAVAGVSVDTGE